MNSVILMGRLTRDPDISYTTGQNGEQNCVARYTLAVDRWRSANGESSTDFISCVTFGRTAEFVEKYLHQGIKILIHGRIQTGSYTNRDGNRVYTTNVVVHEHEFCESRRENGQQGNGYNQNYQTPNYNSPGGSQPSGSYNGNVQGNRSTVPAGDGYNGNTSGYPAGNGGYGNTQGGGYAPSSGSYGAPTGVMSSPLGDDSRFMNIPDGIEEELPFN